MSANLEVINRIEQAARLYETRAQWYQDEAERILGFEPQSMPVEAGLAKAMELGAARASATAFSTVAKELRGIIRAAAPPPPEHVRSGTES